ncbi:hypothetical protein GPECTOR_13g786 [Gonium pectorale]|uniref:Uncharacterized protein n=1 Tax=Gonium pectorale TaxID=33097 RepID=A0A150GN99_GONPE|nr:hypothetical protein GPECTOR_13g786 [Gonium pectorale]|eukprot:KXZ51299.1 hypothetical protein GPECTOR_13g786 [Gonium pectorale]
MTAAEVALVVVVVVVRVPAGRNLASLRCVMATGPTGRRRLRQRVFLDDSFTPCFMSIAPDNGDTIAAVRLALPLTALRAPGTLMLHILPPPVEPPFSEAAPEVAQPPASAHAAAAPQQQWQEGSATTAPLASLTLLVLPPSAAQEVRRLHGEVLGAEAVACLDWHLAQQAGGGGGQERQALILAGATADVMTSGLHDVAYDMGCLLNTLCCIDALVEPEERTEDMPVTDPRVFDGLLRLLASHGMDACLAEAQRALEAAGGGVRPAAGLEAAVSGGGSAVGAEAFAGAPDQTSAVMASVGSTEAPFEGQYPVAGRRVLFLANTAARDSGALGQDGPDSGYQAATSLMGRYGSAPFSLEPAGQPRPGPTWWLRALLRGFQPPALEAAYQDFKADQLVGLDRTSFVLNAGMRAASMYRTYAAQPDAPLSPYLQVRVTLVCLAYALLLSRHCAQGRWPPALLFTAFFAAATMAISAATDLRMRRRFLRQRRDVWNVGRSLAVERGGDGGAGASGGDAASGGGDGNVKGS